MTIPTWLKEMDEVLRGRKADPHLLAAGTAHISIGPLAIGAILLGMIYGIFMGLYALATRTPPSFAQLFATALKVPALFFLTLVVTFPSLYVFSALLGVRLRPKDTLRLIMVPIAVNLAVLASLGPITGFFTLSTTSYAFMKLLNVFFFGISGVIGLKVLLTMLARLEEAQTRPMVTQPAGLQADGGGSPSQPGPAKPVPQPRPKDRTMARATFQVWVVIYALVGAQMGWILRPFIGTPGLPFQWFRGREANFFLDVARTLGELLGAR
jgi:hypothetical protein